MALYITHQDPQIVGAGCVYGLIHRASDMAVWNPAGNAWVTIGAGTNLTGYAINGTKYGTAGACAIPVPASIENIDTVCFFYLTANCASKDTVTNPLVGQTTYGPTAVVNITPSDLESIVNSLLTSSVVPAIDYVGGSLDKHCLASLVLLVSNADSKSVANSIVTRHPNTNAIVNTYTIEVGCGQPVRSIT